MMLLQLEFSNLLKTPGFGFGFGSGGDVTGDEIDIDGGG
jgi:hypothetical protein